MTVVGEAVLDVRPDVDSFASELQSSVEAAIPDVQVPVSADIEGATSEIQGIAAEEVDVPVTADISSAEAEIESIAAQPIEIEANITAGGEGEADIFSDAQAAGAQAGKEFGTGVDQALTAGTLPVFGSLKAAAGAVGASIGALEGLKAIGDAEARQAQTEQIVRATGEAAGVSAEELSEYASQLNDITAQGKGTIQSAGNLLLRFRAVKNEVGEGNDIFNRALSLSVDLGVAMERDTAGGALALGRALSDPTKGLAGLTRANIVFTAEQKATIAGLQESGDLLGAQKVLLDGVAASVGGAGAAFGETFNAELKRATQGLTTIAGAVVSPFIPALEAGAAAVGGLGKAINELPDPAKGFLGLLGGAALGARFGPVGALIGTLTVRLGQLKEEAETEDVPLMEKLATDLIPGIEAHTPRAVEELKNLEDAMGAATEGISAGLESAAEGFVPLIGGATETGLVVSDVAGTMVDALGDVADSHEAVADAAREQHLAELELAGGLLGLQAAEHSAVDAEIALSDARAEVDKLRAEGARGTDEYREAVRDLRREQVSAIEANLGLKAAAVGYVQELKAGDSTQKEAIQKVREFADAANLNDYQTRRLIDSVKELTNKYGGVPKEVKTNVGAVGLDPVKAKIEDLIRKFNYLDEKTFSATLSVGVTGDLRAAKLILGGSTSTSTERSTERGTNTARTAESDLDRSRRPTPIPVQEVQGSAERKRGRNRIYGGIG